MTNITINTTLKSKQDLLNKQLQHLEKIAEFTPSFGPARIALIEAMYQCNVAVLEAMEEQAKKSKSFSIAAISQDTYDNEIDVLKEKAKQLLEEKQQQIDDARSFRHPNSQIEYGFSVGGIDYFKFSDFNNMPPMRSMKTLVYYSEMEMKCDIEFLKWHVEAVDNILLQDKINIFDLKKLNDQIKQRLLIAVDFEHLYKIASVIYFDKDENYEDYDFGYNARKINNWKKHDGIAFFLREPLLTLFPFLKDTEQNLKTYGTVVQKLNVNHLENILSLLPTRLKDKLKNSSYFCQAAEQIG